VNPSNGAHIGASPTPRATGARVQKIRLRCRQITDYN
jgi:hypothetical protein